MSGKAESKPSDPIAPTFGRARETSHRPRSATNRARPRQRSGAWRPDRCHTSERGLTRSPAPGARCASSTRCSSNAPRPLPATCWIQASSTAARTEMLVAPGTACSSRASRSGHSSRIEELAHDVRRSRAARRGRGSSTRDARCRRPEARALVRTQSTMPLTAAGLRAIHSTFPSQRLPCTNAVVSAFPTSLARSSARARSRLLASASARSRLPSTNATVAVSGPSTRPRRPLVVDDRVSRRRRGTARSSAGRASPRQRSTFLRRRRPRRRASTPAHRLSSVHLVRSRRRAGVERRAHQLGGAAARTARGRRRRRSIIAAPWRSSRLEHRRRASCVATAAPTVNTSSPRQRRASTASQPKRRESRARAAPLRDRCNAWRPARSRGDTTAPEISAKCGTRSASRTATTPSGIRRRAERPRRSVGKQATRARLRRARRSEQHDCEHEDQDATAPP